MIFKRKKKRRKSRKRKRKPVENQTRVPSPSEYFRQEIFCDFEAWQIRHPNYDLWLRHQIKMLCKKSVSTQLVLFLDELLRKTGDTISRGLLARKIYQLQTHYLQSFKEYSDRALILLTQREKLFDKWEGIHILGHFGGKRAVPYLRELLSQENNLLLIQTIESSISRIEANAKKKALKRGF